MSVIKDEEIVGYFIGEECVCRNCVTDDETEKEVTQSNLITDKNIGNGARFFCDRCGKEIC